MVTLAEFVRHILMSAFVMGLGIAGVAFVRVRYGLGSRTLKRLSIAAGAILTVVAVLSLISNTTETRCRDNALETCRYNDSIPSMATLVGGFFVIAAIRSWSLYNSRWQVGSPDAKNA